MTVVYIDSVFFLNTLMDAVLLWAAARLAGIPPRKVRLIPAALLGGAYAAAVFLPGCTILAEPAGKAAAWLAITLAAFGGERRFLRLALLFLAVSCGFAGCVLALGLAAGGVPMENGIFYTNVDAGVLLTAAAAAYGVLTVVFRASASHGVAGDLLPVTLRWEDRRLRLTALRDTGNALRDPATGRTVLVADAAQLRDLWPRHLRPLLTPENLRDPAALLGRLGTERVRFRLIPYRAVGVAGGLLLAVRTDSGTVGATHVENLVVALSPTALGDGFGALWSGEERRGTNGKHPGKAGKDSGKAGSAAAGQRPLYRRRGRTASAAGADAGGGAAEPHERSAGAFGAHRAQSASGGVHRPPV